MWLDLRSLWEEQPGALTGISTGGGSIAIAQLSATADLSGVSLSCAIPSGNLSATATLSGASIASSTAAANAIAVAGLTGVSISGSYPAGNLSATASFSGASITWSAAPANLTASAAFTGASIAGATATGLLSLAGSVSDLTGAVVTGCTASAFLTATANFTGVSVALSIAPANLTASANFSGISIAGSTAIGAMGTTPVALSGLSLVQLLASAELTSFETPSTSVGHPAPITEREFEDRLLRHLTEEFSNPEYRPIRETLTLPSKRTQLPAQTLITRTYHVEIAAITWMLM